MSNPSSYRAVIRFFLNVRVTFFLNVLRLQMMVVSLALPHKWLKLEVTFERSTKVNAALKCEEWCDIWVESICFK